VRSESNLVYSGGGLTDHRAPSQGIISRLGRGLPSAAPGMAFASGVSMRYQRRQDFLPKPSDQARNIFIEVLSGRTGHCG
jgi:hypothetical protein